MADVKPFVIICFILADVIAKVPVADLIAKCMADVIAIMVWLMLLPLLIFWYVTLYWQMLLPIFSSADLIAILLW